ncbi:MAG: phosphoenolpyruvate--protein phosphotransferase [Pseudomonadales bacterium]|nr:phosphoenolpyruvate--protein phosphotransferase [Pseudomonadales bacterium]RLU03968.1 MAG: phosphoenolpyruvate--protein phosphotransferase [Ketobacter sp.]
MSIKHSKTVILHGLSVSPGLADGTIHLQRGLSDPIDLPDNSLEYSAENELNRLDQATTKITEDLLLLATRVEKEIDAKLAEVFGFHSDILSDKLLKDELKKEIVDNLVSASSAVKSVFLKWENRFLLMESVIAKEKGEDIRDISIRLRNALAGVSINPFESIPSGCVLVARRILPSDTVFLASRKAKALLLEFGTVGSHAALFTRQMGVPCISGIHNILRVIPDRGYALIDTRNSEVTVNPSPERRTAFLKEKNRYNAHLLESLANASKAAITRSGTRIPVNANVGCHEDSDKAMKNGADGIGLYRLEQAYIGRTFPPSADELLAEIHHTLAPYKAKSVCVRLLDVGSDKPLPFMGFLAESNPALGRRGIRVMREYPEILHTQLTALLALHNSYDLQILVPMVTLPEDVKFVRDMLAKRCSELNIAEPKLGAMIETPAAALSARSIAPYVDFMSFGTNDLTQYVFAADRENAAVEPYFDDASEVIFRLIEIVHNDLPTMPLSVCGELAGRPEHTDRLLQCGISALSVAAPLVAIIKDTIRNISR